MSRPAPPARAPARPAAAARACAALLACAAAVACAAQQRTTLLRASDTLLSAQRVLEQLAQSDFILMRTQSSERLVLRPHPLENLSDNRLSRGDQWAAMARVLLDPRVLELLRSRNIVVQMPPLASDAVARAGLTVREPPAELAPTHLFTGRLRSITRAGAPEADAGAGERRGAGSERTQRTDRYFFEYTIIDARTRAVEWAGSAELARRAHGSLID
ncbi:MAG: hypothetical protein C0475_04450 [Planctomyces sp.]|nr:hypothetical protein [Planctomyces sp.]